MRIGIDFDNSLACYDSVFVRLAQEWSVSGVPEGKSKQEIRQLVRRVPDGELLWQRMQGKAYGLCMREAKLFPGVDGFLRRCAATPGIQVFVISHKTEFGHFDETRTSLRDAARQWMHTQGFFDPAKYAIPEQHIFFESTQQEKVARIASLGCNIFIDDLAELFAVPGFPPAIKKILFSADKPIDKQVQVDHVCSAWPEIEAIIFGH